MKYLGDGPDIPSELLTAAAKGRVVFFCGAGLSVNAGLPTFKDLVHTIYKNVNHATKLEGESTQATIDEYSSFQDTNYEMTLNMLEQRLGKYKVRKALFSIFRYPDFQKRISHQALLKLATVNNCTKIVTTNYDRLFSRCFRDLPFTVKEYIAPCLPTPRNGFWNGIVYLHGKLPSSTKNQERLNQIVLTSSDFGRAYLVDQWAANFVVELFRNYDICFVGYSLHDTVMRYMVDATSALGNRHAIWAFSAFKEEDNQDYLAKKWQRLGINAILYNSHNNHQDLHDTLAIWAGLKS